MVLPARRMLMLSRKASFFSRIVATSAALQVLEHEGVAQAHDLPIDPEDRVAVLVRDVEILADRDEPLSHRIARHVRPPIPRRQARAEHA